MNVPNTLKTLFWKTSRRNYIFLCFVSLYTYGQTGTITGEVMDKNTGEPIPYANVVVISENEIITGSITNDKGFFNLNKIPFGAYKLEIQFIGYRSWLQLITLDTKNRKVNLGRVFIEEDAVSLEGVEVTAERSTIEQKIDRKVINVGRDLTTTGASVSDIIGNIPSVSVNQDGEISLRGNENVRVLVDGKPTNISARELLQQLPTSAIKTIELITNPSAKHNPEGMSGIINITLKKNTKLGFNGAVNLGITFGQRTRYNNALSLNYRAGKVNLYGTYGNQLGKSVTDGTVTRTLENTNQLTDNINGNTSHLFKLGADYYINDANTFSIYTNQNVFDTDINGIRTIRFFDDLSANFRQFDTTLRDNTNATYNADFRHTFPKEAHHIELELDYNRLNSTIGNIFRFTGNSPLNDYQEIIEDQRTNTTLNLDYIYPISEQSVLEMGAETRLRRTANTYITDRLDFNDSNFSYDRDIFSFYTTFSQKLNKWHYNLGLRLEDYTVRSQFNEVSEPPFSFKDKLLNIYPSGFLKYTPNETQRNTYQFSFSRRIDRPSLNQINPIRQLSTPQIIVVGNPILVPQFTNSVELNYTRKLEKGNFSVGGFYRRINDEINRRGFFDDDNPTVLVLDYDNFDSNDAFGVEFSISYRFTDWWNVNASFDVYSRTQKGVIENENISVTNSLLNAKVNTSLKATKDLSFQLFAFYSGRQKILQYELKENAFLNAGARYNFAKGQGTLSLNFNDIFRSQRFAFEAFRTIIQEGEFRRDTRTIYLGLSYRFGGGKNKNIQRKKRDKNEKGDKFL